METTETPQHTVIYDPAETGLAEPVIAALREIFDPEIPVNIYDLGLIYEIQINPDRTVMVKMTLTAPNCPVADSLPQAAEQAVRLTEGVTEARVDLTFDPPFTMEMMSDAAKLELGFL